ncbi:SDR family oxidoreductase [Corallincola platygyrae]|uniref:SDR family oxidoreductase n=1 Tax=Corallincola platygyrae TaxID=1193278 RepID=A0ABW4XKG4_9GAMM
MQIEGKVAVITGAGSGLGKATATLLAKHGAHLALIDADGDKLSDVAEFIGGQMQADRQCRCYPLDVTDEHAVEHCFESIASDFGSLNILINSAGIMRDGMLIKAKDGEIQDKMSLAQFNAVVQVNLAGTFLCGREASIQMVNTQSQGVIINLASVSRAGNVGQSNYSAAKAGVSAMTVTWAKELSRHNIRAAAIAPGVFETPMTAVMKPEAMERLAKAIPAGRLGQAEEIAHTVKFIVENDYFTGRVLELDGGIRV